MQTRSQSPPTHANRSPQKQNADLVRELSPWIESNKEGWELATPVPNVRIFVLPQAMSELQPGLKWTGETLSSVLDIWHAQFLTFNRLTAPHIRISNTYAFPAMVSAFALESGTPQHQEAVKAVATNFRFNARRETENRLRDIFTHEYLVIPLHLLGDHWALAIISFPYNLLPINRAAGTRPTYLFTLDSLVGNQRAQVAARRAIKSWLMFAVNYFLEGDVRGRDIIEFQVEDTAMQPNGVDCGLYVHHHLDTFFQTGNPTKILEYFTNGLNMMTDGDLVNMWRYPTALQCRYTVARMVLGELGSQNHIP